MSAAAMIWPFARAYARHVGRDAAPEVLRADLARRLALLPPAARAYLALGAVFVRWAAPVVFLGRVRPFEGLPEDQAEALLERLQREGRPALRALFVGVKSLVLACCYADPGFLRSIGYRTAPPDGHG